MPQKSIHSQNGQKYITVAIFMSLSILLLTLACILWIARPASPNTAVADIYQNGLLLRSIPLEDGKEPFSFTVTGANGSFNEITVRDGRIGISSASCPDKLCMRQGYIPDKDTQYPFIDKDMQYPFISLLPIVCLPNGLVIQVRDAGKGVNPQGNSVTPDIVTY